MSEPWGIVVVPTEAGRALTEPGRRMEIPEHGSADRPRLQVTRAARPPEVCWGYDDATRSFPPNGLPLWWGGAPVPEGVFRAWQMWDPDATPEAEAAFEATGWTTYDVLGEALDGASGAEWLARALETAGPCRVVLLDLVDGAVVERAP